MLVTITYQRQRKNQHANDAMQPILRCMNNINMHENTCTCEEIKMHIFDEILT